MKVSFSDNKKNDATIEHNVKLQYAASKRVFPKVRWILILLVVGSPLIILIGKILLDWIFVTSPGTIWLEKRTINSSEAGTVQKVFCQNGDPVGADTVVFRVKRAIPENRKEQIALLEAEQETLIKEMTATIPEPAGTKEMVAQIELANQSVAFYEQVRDHTKWLVDKGAATMAELNLAENNLREAKTSLAALNATAAKAAVDRATPAVNPVKIKQIEQSIKALKSISEDLFDVKTGQAGKVSSILVNDGQSFAAGEPLAVIVNTRQIHIVTYVKPKDLKKANIGTVVTVEIPGPGSKIKAVVEQPPLAVDNVPSGISDKIYPAGLKGVRVFLKVLTRLREQETIDGLPIEVKW